MAVLSRLALSSLAVCMVGLASQALSETAAAPASVITPPAAANSYKPKASESLDQVIAKTLPSFNLIYSNTSSGYLANNVTPSASSSVLVQLSIPFYNGGSDTAKKQDAKLKAMQSELEFQAAMRTFEKSLRQSQAEVLNSEDILASRAVSVRSAIASMRAVREQFAFNKGSLLDVISM